MRAWLSTDTRRTWTVLPETTAMVQGYVLDQGWLVLESWTGYRTIAVPTGRTRKFWGVDCPTFDRYDIDTVVRNGIIYGVRSAHRYHGTVAVRP